LLMLAGIGGYLTLPVKLVPDVSFPSIEVSVTLNGAAPSEVETQITREVEAAVSNIPGADHVQSTVTLGRSSTIVNFDIGEDPQRASDEVRVAIDRIRDALPREIEEPVVSRIEFESRPVVIYAVSSSRMSDVELSWFVDDIVARRLAARKGVGQVQRLGGVDREINVTLDPERLEALGLTVPLINNALRSFNADVPGGSTEVGGRTQTVRVLGAANTVDKLRDTSIPTGDGRQLRLGDIASVTSGPAQRTHLAQLENRSVVAFQVMKTMASSDVAVEDEMTEAIAQLQAEHSDVRFRKLISGADNTRESFNATVMVLLEGMLLAALVVFAFLREWRSTIIAALTMPIALIPTFAAMAALGFSLNIITLLALTLVIGVLVDDAIVEIENIEKRIKAGETPYQASLMGADAIGLAVISTTMAIVVIFVPVSLMPGMAGRFFREFGLTVAIAVLSSLLVARLLTPLMAAYFLKPSAHPKPRKPFTGSYRRIVEWALAHRWRSLAGAGLLFVASLWRATTLPTGFTPESDNGIVDIQVGGPPGVTLEEMRRATTLLTDRLHEQGDVDLVFASLGSGGSVGTGTVTILLKKERERTTQAFQAAIRPILLTIPDVRLSYGEGGGSGSNVQVILSGENGDALARAALALERQMRGVPDLANVHQLAPRPAAELVIRPRPDEAARLGVTAEALAAIVRVTTMGDVDANTARFNDGEQRLPVRVRLPDSARADFDTIGNLRVPLASGETVPLSAVASLSFEPGVTRIERFDRERRVTVQAELNGVSIGQALAKIDALPIMQQLPEGVTRPAFGQSADMDELFGGFVGAMIAGVALIFAVLVLLFRSFFKPITILTALPLSLIGAFASLVLSGAALNLPALIGLLMLMGLAAKNSILLVEHAIESERAGVSQHDALIEACRERVRPIVMTTFAMAAGMVPTVLGLGEGSEFRVPMALAVIGGLISSTALSLVLVPVVYEIIDDFEMRVRPRLARFITVPRRKDAAL
ncbi:efflux RND transporter permease subunit, partial [Sphingobium sp. YR768]|uniref:efflux RND transporter permease subunit n=1 Tax=Sphingobium sp. YR768 TaxID=1884365 RepID=UPI0008D37523